VKQVLLIQELSGAAVSAATEIFGRVEGGTVAIIATEPVSIQKHLERKGWECDPGDFSTWKNGGAVLRLLPPDRSRGLEFDGVVVVEPASFPLNLGRQGVLYTALTRANRFLSVVHHRQLPRELKLPT